ncbi:MAG TPA: signal peptidase I [Pyrinomonadaceae bacterium]|nr:signal peptidase I [Pyrinomonadaceae bacterium]
MFRLKRARRTPLFGGITAEDDKDIEVQRPQAAARSNFWAEARLLLRDLIFALMIAALVVVFIVQPVKVEGTSMLPRLHDGERIFVNKMIYYGMPKLARGDIVVFWYPNDPSKSYIKRIVGLPGETVEVREGRVRINGRELEEPYLDPQLNVSHMSLQPVLVKEHYYFVMGDNRDHSSDSRFWGLVPEKYIYGKALFRYWPLASASIISHDPQYNDLPPSYTYGSEATHTDEDQ